MVLLNQAKSTIRDAVKALFTTGGIGLDSTSPDVTDTGLLGGRTDIDSCDVVTGWTNSGDANAETVNNTSGEFKEGVACLNLPFTYSTGTGKWTKTINSADMTNNKLVLWFYISDVNTIATSVSALKVDLGTGGFTNYDQYYFANTILGNGWNSLVVDCDNSDNSNGTGVTLATVDRIRLEVNLTTTQSTNSMRMDFWRMYTPDTLGITDSRKNLAYETGDYYFKTIHNILTTESNGLSIVESGDSDGTNLLSRFTFATIEKGENTELQIDKFYYIEGN